MQSKSFTLSASPATSDPIRVMVVSGSVTNSSLWSRWCDAVVNIEIVSVQRSFRGVVNALDSCNPDVVLLDMDMPDMNSLDVLVKLLEIKASLMVIAVLTSNHDEKKGARALALGAQEFILAPGSNQGLAAMNDFRDGLIETIQALVWTKKARKLNGSSERITRPDRKKEVNDTAASGHLSVSRPAMRPFSGVAPRVLAIGSSTGGPQALQEILTVIAPNIDNIPVLIAQHIPLPFTQILSRHIARVTQRPAEEGRDGDLVLPGHIYLAPGDRHMLVKRCDKGVCIQLSDGPPVNFCKPAVDPMFESVARLYGASSLSLVLTGMGVDGARGAKEIADAGGSVIAQDEKSSVIWGMPRAAMLIGACAAVLPLRDIGRKVNEILVKSK